MTAEGGGPPPGDSSPEAGKPSAAARLIRSIPSLGGLPGPAVGLIGLGIAALSLMVLLDALSLGLGVVLDGLGDFATVLLVALISAYLLDPLIDRFEASGWDRTRAIAVALSLFLVFDTVVLLLLVPYVVTELADLSGNIDRYIADFGPRMRALEEWVQTTTGREIDLRFAAMAEQLPALLDKLPSSTAVARGVLGSATTFAGGALGTLVTWALFPIFTFFFLRDFDRMKGGVFELIPFRWRSTVLEQYLEIDQKIAQFLRGQFILCCLLAVLYALGLGLFTDIDLAVLVGVLSGLLFVIPYFGTVVGVVSGSVLALLKFGFTVEILKVWAVFAVVQFIEGTLLTPKIVGESVGMHPLVVMLSLVVGANLFGFLGILLAVPVAAALQVLLTTGVSRYKGTPWFQAEQEGAPTADDLP